MFKFLLLSVSLPPDYWSECWRRMWARQQCDSSTLGLPVDRWRLQLLPQHNWSDCFKPRRSHPHPAVSCFLSTRRVPNTHTHIQRHTHTHTYRNYRLPLFWQKKTIDQCRRMVTWFAMVCEFSGGRHVDRARSITHRQSCGSRSWIIEAFRESHKWQENVRLCIFYIRSCFRREQPAERRDDLKLQVSF